MGYPGHELFETGKSDFFLVEVGVPAQQPLLDGGQERGAPGLALGADNIFDSGDDRRQVLFAGGGALPDGTAHTAGRCRCRLRGDTGITGRYWLGLDYGVDVLIVEDKRVDRVGKPAGRGPGNADDNHPFAHGPQGVDHVDEIRVARHQNVGADVGVGVGDLDAVSGHFDVDAVFHPGGASRVAAQSQTGRHVDGLDTRSVEGRGVVDELTRAPQFGGASYPVGVGFGYNHAAVVGNLFLQSRDVGVAVAHGQTDLKVLPVDKKGYVVAGVYRSVHMRIRSNSRCVFV